MRATASGPHLDARVDVSKFSDNTRHRALALLLQSLSAQEELRKLKERITRSTPHEKRAGSTAPTVETVTISSQTPEIQRSRLLSAACVELATSMHLRRARQTLRRKHMS